MGFRTGSYMRVWTCDQSGKTAVCSVSISKKNKETNAYDVDFQDGFVRFVGQAAEAVLSAGLPTAETRKAMMAQKQPTKGITVRVTSCDVTNYFRDKNGKTSYSPHYTVFGVELPDSNGNFQKNTNAEVGFQNNYKPNNVDNDGFINVPEDADEELPFK